jgi:hypothetical protein
VFRIFGFLIVTVLLFATPGTSEPFHPEAVLDLIQIPWQGLGYEIVFMPPRPGFRAMTLPAKHRIEVYARPQDDQALQAYDIAHELGHAIDMTFNTAETRKQWMQVRGIDPETPWFGCDRCSDYNTPAGDFAETFAFLLYGPKYYRGRIAPPPPPEMRAALTRFFPKDFLPEY